MSQATKTKKGFTVNVHDSKKKREDVKTKGNVTNRDIADLLEMILERLGEK